MDKKNENSNTNLDKKQITVFIDNKKYNLFSTENEEYIIGVSKYVDNKIKEISSLSSSARKSSNAFYILLCLNIADDLFKQRQLSLKNAKLPKEDFQDEIDSLKKTIANFENETENLKKSLQISQDEVNSLKNTIESLQNENATLKQNLAASSLKDAEDSEIKTLKNTINLLTNENQILKNSFDSFSEGLNLKLENIEITDDLSEVISLHNKTILKLAKKLENLKNSSQDLR